MMTHDPRALNTVQKAGETNLRRTGDAMRAQTLSFHTPCRRDARHFVVRAGVTLVRRSVGVDYLYIWEQGLYRSQNFN